MKKSSFRIELIIFDYDGVLVNSVSLNSKAFVKTFKHFGYKVEPEDFAVGNSLKEQLSYVMTYAADRHKIKVNYKDFKGVFEKIIKKEKYRLKFRKELKALIKELTQDFKLAVVSNNSRQKIEKMLLEYGVRKYFDKITGLGKREKFQGLTKKERLEEILNHFGLLAEQSVVIEDVPKHLKTAHDLGIKTIAFIFEENKHLDFPSYSCLARNPAEVWKCIQSLTS